MNKHAPCSKLGDKLHTGPPPTGRCRAALICLKPLPVTTMVEGISSLPVASPSSCTPSSRRRTLLLGPPATTTSQGMRRISARISEPLRMAGAQLCMVPGTFCMARRWHALPTNQHAMLTTNGVLPQSTAVCVDIQLAAIRGNSCCPKLRKIGACGASWEGPGMHGMLLCRALELCTKCKLILYMQHFNFYNSGLAYRGRPTPERLPGSTAGCLVDARTYIHPLSCHRLHLCRPSLSAVVQASAQAGAAVCPPVPPFVCLQLHE